MKSEFVKISKWILEKLSNTRSQRLYTKKKKWKNKDEVIDWFMNIDKKH